MIDEFDLVRAGRPSVAAPTPEVLARHRAALMDLAGGEEVTKASPRRWKRRWLIPIAAALALTLAAAAWALTHGPRETTSLSCGLDHVIASVSGDPLEDCAAIWGQLYDQPAPPLVAYDNGANFIVVVPKDFEPPPGWTRLADDFTQDDRVVELDQILNDFGGGLNSGCFSQADAQPIIDAALAITGLDWPTTVVRVADGVTTCAVATPRDHAVTVIALTPLTLDPNAPIAVYARAVHDATTARCLSLDQAEKTARDLAVANGLDPTGGTVRVETVPTPDAACARATTSVNGATTVIRGR
jgi:hypothetical protein